MADKGFIYGASFFACSAWIVWAAWAIFQSGRSTTPSFLIWSQLFFVPLWFYSKGKLYWARKDGIHGTQSANIYPHRDPILGLDWLIDMLKAVKSNRVLEALDQRFEEVGSTFWHLSTGTWIMMTNEPENVKAILGTKFEDWPIGGVRQRVTQITLGDDSIFSVNGKAWHNQRAMIRPSFTRNQIADLECLDKHVERFLEKIPGDGSAIELQELLYLLTMDTATDFMFGYSTDNLVDPEEESLEFGRCFDYMLLAAAKRGRLGWMTFLVSDKELDRSVAYCREYVDKYIVKAMADRLVKERSYVFLNEIVATGASKEQIRDHILSMIVGGRDTSAGTMASLFWVLSRHPDIWKKLQDEVAVLNGERPTWEELRSLKYLNNVLREILRLYSPVATNMRVAARDTILPRGGGPDGSSPLFIPKNTQCRWSSYSYHRRRDVYGDDAEYFRPERWDTLRTTWEYVAFSGGPRICVGQQFALTQMAFVLTRMLQTFGSIEAADERPMLHSVSTTTSLVNGCWVKFRPLENSG